MNMAVATHSHSQSVGKSLAASLIFVAMLFAALSLWTALPLTWLYIGSKVSHTQFPAEAPYAVVIVGLVASIVIVAWLISRLNRLYVEITGTNRLAPMRPSWMRSMRDTRGPGGQHDRGRGRADGLRPARRPRPQHLVLPARRLTDTEPVVTRRLLRFASAGGKQSPDHAARNQRPGC